jgi:hypothetical protein
VVAWTLAFAPSLLGAAGVVLLIVGGGVEHGVGAALLIFALLAMATPISPLLRATVRRRRKAQQGRRG